MVEMLVCQHNMRYLATSDLLDVGRDCCCFAEGGPGVDEQYSGAVTGAAALGGLQDQRRPGIG